MATAISLWFDEKLETSIRMLWSELAYRQISSALHDGPYRPHVTIGIWEEARVSELANALKQFSKTQSNIPVIFEVVGLFPGSEGVAFLQPTVSSEILRVHSNIHTLARDFTTLPVSYYLPNSWNPHCTMAWRVTRAKALEACEYLLAKQLPLKGHIEAIGIIDTPAEVELHKIGLGVEQTAGNN